VKIRPKGGIMTDYAITAEDLTYYYGDLTAVNHINFQVAEGEILGFLGPNGAGKTTTVNILTGQMKPKAGRAVLLGMDVAKNIERVQGNIGVCFETTNLYEQMTAIENLNLFARLFGVKHFDATDYLSRVGLDKRGRDKVETYSKGMKQRLMVARSLVNRPKILFLDEPTAGLDPTSSEAIREVILREKERGATVFLTTHDMMEADKLSDRVAFMNQGNIVALDTPLNLKRQYGKRALKIKVSNESGTLDDREIALDTPDTVASIQELFAKEQVITVHSEEATLEDIFINITGRGLTE
jgi:ABC-2 type transport system ATP-binding protein